MKTPALLLASALLVSAATHAAPADDAATVAELDREYQLAVKRNDAATMARILADDFVLIAGNGTVHDREALLAEARSASVQYEQQDELEQQVRVWGDTAVVTARLWVKGTRQGQDFDRKLWFSDIYVRSADGWRYVLGQVGQRE